jgi:hypothetical protein
MLVAALFVASIAVSASASSAVLPFVHNDYGAALGRAKSERRALFVESWAPW